MGYSDEPLSEHSLTGTRNRPQTINTRGTREGGKRGAATSVCDKTPMPTSVPSTSFDDPQRLHTCHNKLPTFSNITPLPLTALLELSNVCRQKITNTGTLGHVVEL